MEEVIPNEENGKNGPSEQDIKKFEEQYRSLLGEEYLEKGEAIWKS